MQDGEDNLDVILAQFALEERHRTQTVFRECAEAPSARLFASITAVSAQVSTPAEALSRALHGNPLYTPCTSHLWKE